MAIKVEPEWIDEGDGAKALRLIPNGGEHLDPFVLFDEYFVDPSASFPMHPHGGFEGYQFLMEGSTEYNDNRGDRGLIGKGEMRRFVAGPGFEHSEYPRSSETVRGYLVWIKLPSSRRDIPIHFRELHGDEVIVVENGVAVTRTVFGEGSPFEPHTPAVFKHYMFKKDTSMKFDITTGWNGFLYVSTGSVNACGLDIGDREGAFFEPGETCEIMIEAGTEMALLRGRMLNEEIVQEGHFVR
ncbi:MAG: pirin family protein [Thermoplasmatota archaeon]